MLFLLIVLPVAIGFACLKLLDSKQWLQAMIASALVFCIAAGWWFKQPFFGLFIGVSNHCSYRGITYLGSCNCS